MTAYPSSKFLEKRINIFAKVISIFLRLIGAAVAVVQILQISPFLPSHPGWTLTLSNILTLIIGILLLILGKGKAIKKVVHYSLFSGREKMKRLIFSLPISAILIIITLQSILDSESSAYEIMNSEGGIIESGTSIAYLLAFVLAIPVGNYFMNRGQKLFGILYYIFSVGLLFIGLEEISWGQILIGWQSPEFFQTYNSKEEITIHNLEWFKNYVNAAYILIGFIGSFSWCIFQKNRRYSERYNNFVKYFIPSWFLSSFFYPSLIIFAILEYMNRFGSFVLKEEEPVELILSLGFCFFIVTNFFRQPLEFEKLKPVLKKE